VNNTLTVTQSKAYCILKKETPAQLEAMAELQEKLGDMYQTYFAEQIDVKLSDQAVEDQQFLSDLLAFAQERLGDKFAEYFEVKQEFKPTAKFHEDLSTNPAVQEKAQPFLDDFTIKPYAPTVKP
jgi:hypothetical protein